MKRLWAPGPVFEYECLTAARRWQLYAARATVLLVILAGLSLLWRAAQPSFHRLQESAAVGRYVFDTVVVVELVAVLLVAPAATAGAICVEKSRGTLVHLLVTDVSAREVVYGKLAARLVPMLALVLSGLPVLALCSLFGGIDGAAIVGAFLVTAGTAMVACTVSLTLSVWARRPHHALLPTYVALAAWIVLSALVSAVLEHLSSRLFPACLLTNPFIAALEYPISSIRFDLKEQAAFLAIAILVSMGLAGVAARSIRRVVLEQANRPAKPQRAGLAGRVVALLPGPPLDGNPVLWREWHRKRPTRWIGRLWMAYAIVAVVASVGVVAAYCVVLPGAVQLAAQVNAWEVTVGLLLLSITSASSLGEERDRGSLDVILATPLETREILWGKWCGSLAVIPRLAILPMWLTMWLAIVTNRWFGVFCLIGLLFAYAAAITSLGLALATWLRRLSWAVGGSVLCFALLTIGSAVVVSSIGAFSYRTDASRDRHDTLMLGNPFMGIVTATEYTGEFTNPWGGGTLLERKPVWPLVWMAAYMVAAAALLGATLATFDRCLGRPRVLSGDRPRTA